MSGERPPHVWLNGSCVAMLSDLPDGTWFNYDADDPSSVDEADEHWRSASVHPEPVIVLCWADGTTPAPPNPDTDDDMAERLMSAVNLATNGCVYLDGEEASLALQLLGLPAAAAAVTPPTEDEEWAAQFKGDCLHNDGSSPDDCRLCTIRRSRRAAVPTPSETVPVLRTALVDLATALRVDDVVVRHAAFRLLAAAGVSGE